MCKCALPSLRTEASLFNSGYRYCLVLFAVAFEVRRSEFGVRKVKNYKAFTCIIAFYRTLYLFASIKIAFDRPTAKLFFLRKL